MKLLKTFTERSNHPDFLGNITKHKYFSDGPEIFIEITDVEGRTYPKQRVIPDQHVKEEVFICQNQVDVLGRIKLKNNESVNLKREELNWLSDISSITVKKVSSEAVEETQKYLDEYMQKAHDLGEFFKEQKFHVVNTTRDKIYALEITKKDVTVNIWIDQDNNDEFTYQAGYSENPFGKKRHSKKQEALLRQVNTIIDEVISEKIPTYDFRGF